MKWVTREKARVDRIACPWLISRFIDKEPTTKPDGIAYAAPFHRAYVSNGAARRMPA